MESSFLPKNKRNIARIFALTVLAIFRSFFGKNDDFINLFWDLLTFRELCFLSFIWIKPWLQNKYQSSAIDVIIFWLIHISLFVWVITMKSTFTSISADIEYKFIKKFWFSCHFLLKSNLLPMATTNSNYVILY